MSPRRWAATVAAAVLTIGLLTHPGASSAAPPTAPAVTAAVPAGQTALVRMRLTGEAMFDELLASGADIANRPRTSPGQVLADVVVTGEELAALTARGATVLQVVPHTSAAAVRSRSQARVAADTLNFLQAYWWTTNGRTFLATQVFTSASDDPDVEITVTWRTADGTTGSYPLVRFEDSDEYQYHVALPQRLPAQPVSVTATSSLGGTTIRPVTPQAWPGVTPPPTPSGYQKDFIDAYMTPIDVQARIKRLKRQYPSLVDVIDLPNQTQGYKRTAAGFLGDPATTAVGVETVKFGSQGVNGFQARTVDPGAPNRPLTATWRSRVLTVSLATDATGQVTSTTDQVAAIINERHADRFRAFVPNGSTGEVMPVVAPVRLDDGLAGSEVPTKPWTVQALRIGKVRDGSKIGVLAYSQEHAREWATPLVTMEFAERLLRNYATDPATRELVDSVDVFVIPTVNPDGANYSFNDYNFQRKNMVNHCTGAARDPRNRNAFGVDLNRNYTVGSYFDGYVGASANCLSGTYAGTAELSEAESRNVIALAEEHSNIKFAMNVHSYGGYFMWSPGAYKAEGRVTLPRPSIDESKFISDSAKRIVGAIATERGTVTWPQYTGPVADVLYSAAGNSADQLYYELGIAAWDFEVGNDIWNETTGQWEAQGFQPPYDEAHAESQEYAGGLIELVRVAKDTQAAAR